MQQTVSTHRLARQVARVSSRILHQPLHLYLAYAHARNPLAPSQFILILITYSGSMLIPSFCSLTLNQPSATTQPAQHTLAISHVDITVGVVGIFSATDIPARPFLSIKMPTTIPMAHM